MKVELVYVAYNRLEYTKLSLPSLLQDPDEQFSVMIWDNGSTDGTREYLMGIDDPRISRREFPDRNAGLHGAFNHLVRTTDADLIGIIPNDFILTPGWLEPLVRAHSDIPRFGMVGCWHFSPDDFDQERAAHKLQTIEGHTIFRHPWTGGGAGLVKSSAVRQFPPLKTGATTVLWMQMAWKGYVNGFYFPLLYVEHMDDIRSEHCALARRFFDPHYRQVLGLPPRSTMTMDVHAEYHEAALRSLRLHQYILDNLLDDPFEPSYYARWRNRLRRVRGLLRQNSRQVVRVRSL